MALVDKTAILADIASLLADNASADISAADVRSVVNDITDSMLGTNETKDLSASLIIGDEAGGDYSEFETNGFQKAVGGAIAYRDEYPAQLVPAGGQAAPSEIAYTIAGVDRECYSFDGGSTEEALSGSFEIPHDYAYGETIEVHMHFRPTTNATGDAKWFFDWEHSPVNNSTVMGYNNPPSGQTGLTLVETIPANKQYYQVVRAFGDLPDLGFKLGDKIGFTIRRDPTDAEDTYSDELILEQVALHIPVDTAGSRERYVK